MIARRTAWLGVALAFSNCSPQQPPTPRASRPIPAATTQARPSADASTAAHPAVISLDALRPISTRPGFAAMARAVQLGDDPRGHQFIEQQLRMLEAPAPELQRLHLWLGYAYRQRNDVLQALSHFEKAGSIDWSLADYARFAAAESQVALGRAEQALHTLGGLKRSGPLSDAIDLQQAQIWAQTGRVMQAVVLWRSYLERTPQSEPERARVNLMLAEALVSLSAGNKKPEPVNFEDAGGAGSADAHQQEAFERLDPLQIKSLDAAAQERAVELRHSLVSIVMAGQPLQQQQCKMSDRINELESLVERREVVKALPWAQSLLEQLQSSDQRYSMYGCRVLFAAAQLRQFKGELKEAAAAFDTVANMCQSPDDLVARALFQSGRRLQDQHDAPAAIARFEALEKRFAQHRLADDARLRSANAYLELGSESKFVDLILHMPEDFPTGDQVPEGLFQVALRRMTKGDWSGTESLLSTMGKLPRIIDRDDAEQAERQQYFLARAQIELGQTEAALMQLERLVRDRPFSYYMLLAYTRLSEKAPERAERARAASIADTRSSPFSVPYRPEFDAPGFTRAMELMALGETDKGGLELRSLGLSRDVEPQLLWTRALFEAAAGDLKATQKIVRERLRDWIRYWPVGAWETAWKIAFPQPYYEIVRRESTRSGVPIPLVYAIMREESLFDRDAVSAADAHGLMQLIVPTARRAAKDLGIVASASALKRPEINIALGCQELKKLLNKFSKQQLMAIPAYNAGPGRPIRWMKDRPDMEFDVWVESIPFAETRMYFKHVLASWSAYAWLYDRGSAEVAMRLPLRVSD
jgi:soluble lytic murein transglycosylase